MEGHKARKYTKITLSLGIGLIFIILLVFYFEGREPRVERENKIIEAQKLVERIVTVAPRTGALNPDLRIIEFGNFTCPSCKEVSPIIKQVLDAYPDKLQHVWFHAFDRSNLLAKQVAIASECAGQQNKFFPYHDRLFEEQDELNTQNINFIAQELELDLPLFQTCLASPTTSALINDYLIFAQQTEVDSTPYLLINEQIIAGEFDFEELHSIINEELSKIE